VLECVSGFVDVTRLTCMLVGLCATVVSAFPLQPSDVCLWVSSLFGASLTASCMILVCVVCVCCLFALWVREEESLGVVGILGIGVLACGVVG